MASTARMLFNRATSKGGFPVEAYYRIQASKNCYIVAVCMWLTVKIQRDYPNRKQLPIDVGHIGQRHVIATREGLEWRVIKDKSDNALDLCIEIVGDGAEFDELEKVNRNFSPQFEPNHRQRLDHEKYQERQRTLLNELSP